MGRRETDTSASDPTGDAVESDAGCADADATTGRADEPSAEASATADGADETGTQASATTEETAALFDLLVEEDVFAVDGDGGVRTTEAFDDTHAVYHDSYVGVSEAEFHESVAAAFGLADADAAADLVAERGVSRAEFVCYLAVRSHLDSAEPHSADDPPIEDLAAMAGMVWEVVPDSPVPPTVADVTDDPGAFVGDRDRAVVSVWKRFCDPCDSLKADLPALLDAVPDDVPVGGVDGEVAADFCETYGVESAPEFVLFRDGDHLTVRDSDPDEVVEALRSVFGDVG